MSGCMSYVSSAPHCVYLFFFFNDTATTEIYTLSLHDALPIFAEIVGQTHQHRPDRSATQGAHAADDDDREGDRQHFEVERSEEHTSELQSRQYLVCRLLLEKKTNTLTRSYLLTVARLDYSSNS